jgi:DNA-binding MarR family transcriptional regulator
MSFIMHKMIDKVNKINAANPSAEDLFEAIHSTMHVYRSRKHLWNDDNALGMTHMHGKVLGFFARHPGATQKDLAERMGRDKGQLARLISTLKDNGLIEGQTDPADRRNIRLELTARGQEHQKTLQLQAQRVHELAAAALSSEERSQLVSLLLKVHASLSKAD